MTCFCIYSLDISLFLLYQIFLHIFYLKYFKKYFIWLDFTSSFLGWIVFNMFLSFLHSFTFYKFLRKLVSIQFVFPYWRPYFLFSISSKTLVSFFHFPWVFHHIYPSISGKSVQLSIRAAELHLSLPSSENSFNWLHRV